MLRYEDITDEHGRFLVRLARQAIETYLNEEKRIKPPPNTPEILKEKSGVFVTLNKLIAGKEEELRGCIGYIQPVYPLVEATIDAAISAATRDPRFPPLSAEELSEILVEVTILTPPELIKVSSPTDYLKEIIIGRDGLIVEYKGFGGTLLPQVPVEYGWDVRTFLEHLCWKAFLPKDCWKWPETKIYRYQGIIFKEDKPGGSVHRIKLTTDF
ncbi:MAG: TIGR00296 family protein [Crenarchaeota archaeon]|nr:TIGR00296 family protein [Thermoproteota archaeon]